MTPQLGQHVKCLLRNGALAEGIVEDWADKVVLLNSLDGESMTIIMHPEEDIMLVKVMRDLPDKKEDVLAPLEEEKVELEEKFEETRQATDPTDPDSIKKLAELRIELAKQERRIITEKLREHRPSSQPGTTSYHYPSVITGKPTPSQPRIPNGHPRSSKKPSP